MSEKFEDLMRPGLSRRGLTTEGEDIPESVAYINLLSAACFFLIFPIIGGATSWMDAMAGSAMVGAIFGPAIFMVGQIFCRMYGGKGSFWVAVIYFSFYFVALLIAAYLRWF